MKANIKGKSLNFSGLTQDAKERIMRLGEKNSQHNRNASQTSQLSESMGQSVGETGSSIHPASKAREVQV